MRETSSRDTAILMKFSRQITRSNGVEINSVQQMAQYLEDYFNLIKEYPHIQIEHKLDSLFLQILTLLKNF